MSLPNLVIVAYFYKIARRGLKVHSTVTEPQKIQYH